jgi:riboflavin synthase
MFTGIIEEVGIVTALSPHRLSVRAQTVSADLSLGDSISVNGACLTVVERSANGFSADLAEETLARTNLGRIQAGDGVNLERALLASARFGGHIVQGHVDGVGTITSFGGTAENTRLIVEAPSELARYVVEKGFIAVDGISLTVTTVDGPVFGVAVVPYTREHTVLGTRQAGDRVNLEMDILAKYIERLTAERKD